MSLPHLEARREGSALLLEVKVKWVQGSRERGGFEEGWEPAVAPPRRRKVTSGGGCASVGLQTLKSPLPPLSHLHPSLSPNQYTSCFYPWLLWYLSLLMGVTESLEGQTHTHTHMSRGHPHPRARDRPASPLRWGTRAEALRASDPHLGPPVPGGERL